MTLLETLIEGRRRIAEVGWTQGAFARDASGEPLHINDGLVGAVCYCAEGAVYGNFVAIQALREAAGFRAVYRWQDEPGRTREEVIALFDKAIADVRERAS